MSIFFPIIPEYLFWFLHHLFKVIIIIIIIKDINLINNSIFLVPKCVLPFLNGLKLVFWLLYAFHLMIFVIIMKNLSKIAIINFKTNPILFSIVAA